MSRTITPPTTSSVRACKRVAGGLILLQWRLYLIRTSITLFIFSFLFLILLAHKLYCQRSLAKRGVCVCVEGRTRVCLSYQLLFAIFCGFMIFGSILPEIVEKMYTKWCHVLWLSFEAHKSGFIHFVFCVWRDVVGEGVCWRELLPFFEGILKFIPICYILSFLLVVMANMLNLKYNFSNLMDILILSSFNCLMEVLSSAFIIILPKCIELQSFVRQLASYI